MGKAFDELRDRTRATVHDYFSLPAVARSPDGGTTLENVNIRLHRNLRKPFGDLDREGFALVMEMHNQVIVDRTEWYPLKNWTLDFGRGRVFNIDNIDQESEERFVRCVVTEYEE
jgi:hypothetical protein